MSCSAGLPPPIGSGLGAHREPDGRPRPPAGAVRFAPCSHCGSRKRVTLDAQGRLHGRCLRCGRRLRAPLPGERGDAYELVGVPAPMAAAPETHAKVDARPLVLIVDDDADIRDMLELALRGLGVRTIAAADGIDALDLADRRPPDAIVTDLTMPRLDGRQLIRRVRHARWGHNTPVIIFSGAPVAPSDLLDQPQVHIASKSRGLVPVLEHLLRTLGIRPTPVRRAPP